MPDPSAPGPASPYDAAAFVAVAAREGRGALVTTEVPGARLVALERRTGPFVVSHAPPLGFYHGPSLAAWPAEPEATRGGGALGLLVDAVQARAHAFALALAPGTGVANGADALCPPLPDVRPLVWRGVTCEVRFTYRLRLDGPDAVRAAMRPNARRTLPAHPEPLAQASPEALAAVVVAAYTRHRRRPPLGEAALARVAAGCEAAGIGRVVQVGEAVALVLDTGDGAAPCLALNGGPGLPRLVWALAADAALAGRVLDLIGANTPSIADAKRRLGATLVPYVRATWHRAGLARAVSALRPLV